MDKECLLREIATAEAVHDDEEAGVEMPDPAPGTVSMPNFAKSKVINVRVNEYDHAALISLAEQRGVAVSDLVRAAVRRHVDQSDTNTDDAEELLAALRDRGLQLTRTNR